MPLALVERSVMSCLLFIFTLQQITKRVVGSTQPDSAQIYHHDDASATKQLFPIEWTQTHPLQLRK